ncbi:zinc finger protein with KRAB and SCAN domains 7-like [Anopheles aquasalis]|uniref:zinc finger protein with KRAB and SCAN domains 7-like n=1 Tax=Anopheles aquasalis TaxID=42839 RepID=UPI00215A4D6C|nr:zinc finger protein with KRAB and SCAN domains 7-like [Anopheles aquasalis]
MRHDDPASAKLEQTEPFHFPYCYICNTPDLQMETGNLCMLFQSEQNGYSAAKTLTEILQIDVTPELCHSQLICINCNLLCVEYQQLLERVETIRIQMTVAYNQTVMKLAGLTEKVLKDTPVTDENLEQALQSIEKGFMSIDEVFQMEGLVADSIIEDPSSEQIEGVLPKLTLDWHGATPDQPIDSSVLLSSATIADEQPQHVAVQEPEPPILTTVQDVASTQLEPQETNLLAPDTETPVDCDSSNDDKLHSLIADRIVEVKAEDGTVMYCVYENVIESYSDQEEAPPETMMASNDDADVVTNDDDDDDDVVEYDEVIVESSEPAATEHTPEEQPPPPTSLLDAVEEQQAPVDGNERNESAAITQPLFFKVEDVYYCTTCSSVGKMNGYHVKSIAHHLKVEHGEKILVCERCDAVFSRRSAYNKHMDQHTADDCGGDFNCDICAIKLDSVRALRIHRKNHVPATKLWSCELCEKKYVTKNLLEVHMNTHTGERPYQCTVCSKDFSSKYVLAVHMKTHSERTRNFVCTVCNASFFKRNNLVQHERIHLGLKEYMCRDCGKEFLSQHNLNVHRIIHAGNKPFSCRTCGKSFARKAEMIDHERIHTGEKPFACDICDARFAQRSNLHSHRRVTHMNDKRFKCEICGACFKRRRLLVYHERSTHTGERPYKCDQCTATFAYPEHFQKHKRIHSGAKPFSCEVCHKSFNSRDNRNAHRYVHSDKKPFECVICGAGFMRKSHLYGHMQKFGHLNDTIIVNQPHIKPNDTLDFTHESFTIASADALADDTGEPIEPAAAVVGCSDEGTASHHSPRMIIEGEEDTTETMDDIIETDEYYIEQDEDYVEGMHEDTSNSTPVPVADLQADDDDSAIE